MQAFYSIPHLAKRLGLAEQSIVDSMAALKQEPAMLIDDKNFYSAESVSLLQTEVAREERIRQLEIQLGYDELNQIIYPDGSGLAGTKALIEFVEDYGERPRKDYTAELEAAKDGGERAYVFNKSTRAAEYWAEVENKRQHIEIDRAVAGLPQQAERMIKYLWRKKRDLGTGRKIVGPKEFMLEVEAFDFSPYAEIIAKFELDPTK